MSCTEKNFQFTLIFSCESLGLVYLRFGTCTHQDGEYYFSFYKCSYVHRWLSEAESNTTTPLNAAIAHECTCYMSTGVAVRDDNYRLTNVIHLLYVYSKLT